MTTEEREQLAKKVEAKLREWWGDKFREIDVMSIYDYCMDAAMVNDAIIEASEYNRKYG